ncbi:MAG: hypothetical protein ABJF23_32375 [Bryobacteraceae bacterium]
MSRVEGRRASYGLIRQNSVVLMVPSLVPWNLAEPDPGRATSGHYLKSMIGAALSTLRAGEPLGGKCRRHSAFLG